MRTLLSGAALKHAWKSVRARVTQARSGEKERGASAIEWVVISMIAVGLILGAGILISQAVQTKAGDVQTCINGASSTSKTNKC